MSNKGASPVGARVNHLLSKTRAFVNECQPGRNGSHKQFEDFVGENRHFHNQWNLLGIYICGYIFRPLLGDTAELLSERGEHPYNFRFKWTREGLEESKYLLHEMFSFTRTTLQSDIVPLPFGKFCPEYLLHLPAPLSPKIPNLHKSENDLRSDWTCHYCTLGEMSFYLYAWRLLLRHSQVSGWNAPFSTQAVSLVPRQAYALQPVSPTIWNVPNLGIVETPLGNFETPERKWLDHVPTIRNSAAADWWRRQCERLDGGGSIANSWLADWKAIGLVTQTKAGKRLVTSDSLCAMIRYAMFLAGRDRIAIRRSLAQSLHQLSEAPSVEIDQLADIDAILQPIVYRRLAIEHDRDVKQSLLLKDLVLNFHALVRFPVLPYFYWSALDPAPRSHLALPIWRSFSSPTKTFCWREDPRSVDDCRSLANCAVNEVSVAGIAVLAVRPLDELDWTIRRPPRGSTYPLVGGKRLRAIRAYVELLAQIPAEEVYYSKLQQRFFSMKHAGYLNHEIMEPVEQLAGQYDLLLQRIEGSELESHISLHRHVFQPLIRFCYTQMKSFEVIGGKPTKWTPQAICISDFVRILGVILGDETCNKETQPTPRLQLESTGFTIKVEPSEDFTWEVDTYKAVAMIREMVVNAQRVTFEANRNTPVEVMIVRHTDLVKVTVLDKGTGIPRENWGRIFELDFSSRGENIGGIGLYLVHQYATAAGGEIKVANSVVDSDTTLELTLPLQQNLLSKE